MTLLLTWVDILAVPFLAFLLRWGWDAWRRHAKEQAEAKRFRQHALSLLCLPRDLGYHRGSPIVADVDLQGNSVLRHRRKHWPLPKHWMRDSLDAWNITPQEAQVVIDIYTHVYRNLSDND
jgi:hypothetical protein